LLWPAGEGARAQAPAANPVPNPGFEEGAPHAPPPRWTVNSAHDDPNLGYGAAVDTARPYKGRASARLHGFSPAEAGKTRFGSLANGLDARPYRGRRIRLTAAVRAEAPAESTVGLWLRVDRPSRQMGFFDNMADRPIRSAEWATYTIEGDVAQDSTGIAYGLLLAGSGVAWVDEVSIEDIGPASAPDPAPDPTAQRPPVDPDLLLFSAIAMLREHHINSASVDWPRVVAEAKGRIEPGDGPRAAYPAIQYVIDALNEKHTMLRPAPSWAAPGAAARKEVAMPTHALLEGRVGMVSLPAFMGTEEEGKRYASTLSEALLSFDRQGVCGWIVDLRGNGGGNMWPMLKGLDALLGEGPFGSFHNPKGKLSYWVRTGLDIHPADTARNGRPAFALKNAAAPLAVLLGPRTASSGEMTAIALIGRPGVRTFGAASAGYSTANRTFHLPDGAWLIITGAYARDRSGREYKGAIVPDEPTAADTAEAAAVRWLSSQGCR
jgi:hypothetical protein